MRKSSSTLRRDAILSALEATQAAQNEYWASLGRLEELLGRDLDGTTDFSYLDVDMLLASEKRI